MSATPVRHSNNPEIQWMPYNHYLPIFQTDGTITTWGAIRNQREQDDIEYSGPRRGGGPELNEADEKEREVKAPPSSPNLSDEMERDMAAEAATQEAARSINDFVRMAAAEVEGKIATEDCLGRIEITWPNSYCERINCTSCAFIGYFWSVDDERVNPFARELTTLSPCISWQTAARQFLALP